MIFSISPSFDVIPYLKLKALQKSLISTFFFTKTLWSQNSQFFLVLKNLFAFLLFQIQRRKDGKGQNRWSLEKKVFVVVVDQSNTFYIKFIFFCQVADNVRFFPFILKECFAVFCYIFELPKRYFFFFLQYITKWLLFTYLLELRKMSSSSCFLFLTRSVSCSFISSQHCQTNVYFLENEGYVCQIQLSLMLRCLFSFLLELNFWLKYFFLLAQEWVLWWKEQKLNFPQNIFFLHHIFVKGEIP